MVEIGNMADKMAKVVCVAAEVERIDDVADNMSLVN